MDNLKLNLIGKFLKKNPKPKEDELEEFLNSIDLSFKEFDDLNIQVDDIKLPELDEEIGADASLNEELFCSDMIDDLDDPFDLPGDILDELGGKL